MFTWQSNGAHESSPTTPYSPLVDGTASAHQLADASLLTETSEPAEKRVNTSNETNLEDSKSSVDSNQLKESRFLLFNSEQEGAPPIALDPSIIRDTLSQLSNQTMPRPVDSLSMETTRHRPYENSERRPSPPSIATLTQSPSPSVSSLDRSSVSTPTIRRPSPSGSMQPPPLYSYSSDPSMGHHTRTHHNSHFSPRGEDLTQGYLYNSHPSFDHRYASNDSAIHPPYHVQTGLPPPLPMLHPGNHARESYNISYPLPGQANVAVVHTDDASTKLSDKVRRRCFNCCTTDTSTWRRSNLSPGKVLCNKCGLFERTHSRPRPEQFPHKRGPLSSSTLRSRTPPAGQLPAISPPYQYNNPSIAPLNSVPDPGRHHHSNALPEIQSWIDDPDAHSIRPPEVGRTLEPSPHARPSTPSSASTQHAPPEVRDQPNARESHT